MHKYHGYSPTYNEMQITEKELKPLFFAFLWIGVGAVYVDLMQLKGGGNGGGGGEKKTRKKS